MYKRNKGQIPPQPISHKTLNSLYLFNIHFTFKFFNRGTDIEEGSDQISKHNLYERPAFYDW